jgi:hypothetical protein
MQGFWNWELTVLQWMMLATVTVLVLTCLRWWIRRLRIGRREKWLGQHTVGKEYGGEPYTAALSSSAYTIATAISHKAGPIFWPMRGSVMIPLRQAA